MSRPHPVLIDLAAGRPLPNAISGVDWLLSSAREHRMSGLLGRALELDRRNLTPEHWRRLAAFNLATRSHHRRLWRSLEQLVARLREIGIEVASFKGVTAEARWYDGPGERPCADIDVLLSPYHWDRIEDVVALIQPDHRLVGSAQVLARLNQLQHVDLLLEPGVALDLHFDLLKVLVRGRHAEEIWERTIQWTAAGRQSVRVIDAETSLIQSLLHLTKDRFPYLLGFVEVARIVEREQLDWDYIDRFLREEGLTTAAYLALGSVFETLGLSPPVAGKHGWRRPAWTLLWGPRTQLRGRSGRLTHHRRQFWIPLLAEGRFTEGVRRLWQLAFPPKELMDHYHPTTHGPYLWRLLSGRRHRAIQRRKRALDVR